MKETFTIVEDGVKRAAAGVDSRFDVSGKASRAAHGWVGQSIAKACCLHIYRPGKSFHACMTEVAHRCTFDTQSQTPGEEALQKAIVLHTMTSY